MAAVTRLGLYGGSRAPYGSFSGKTEQVVPTVTLKQNFMYEVYILTKNSKWERGRIVFTGVDFGEVS